MKIILPTNYKSNIDYYVKIIKRKFTLEGLGDIHKRKIRHLSKKKILEIKRIKKHILIKVGKNSLNY